MLNSSVSIRHQQNSPQGGERNHLPKHGFSPSKALDPEGKDSSPAPSGFMAPSESLLTAGFVVLTGEESTIRGTYCRIPQALYVCTSLQ